MIKEGATKCIFGELCQDSTGCSKVLTKTEFYKAVHSKELLQLFVAPPIDCFKPNKKASQ